MSEISRKRPLVGVVADVKQVGLHPFHVVGEKYMAALAYGAGVLPVALPPVAAGLDSPDDSPFYDLEEALERIDGLFLPGSASNMEPRHYNGATDPDDASPRDPQRDATSLSLIGAVLARGLPLLCVCRGFQELNVALGGSLHQQVHLVAGLMDHRADAAMPRARQYAYTHEVRLADNGLLRRLAGAATAPVNSIHEQGVDRLAARLVPQAWAPDGLIEAASVADASGFALGVQWHPEWRFWEDALSTGIFQVFGEAARAFAEKKAG